MKRHIPNTITCLNLFSGCLGIVFAFNGNLNYASYAILIAAIFDFLDGMIARLLKAYSDIGKELDSLADMVSFGVLPAVIVYQLFSISSPHETYTWIPYSAFIIAVFSGLRLAKFNIDTRQAEHFIGLPTPANAMLIGSLPLILSQEASFMSTIIVSNYFLVPLSIVMSLLLVAELPLISLKFKSLNIKDNILRYVLIISSIMLFAGLQFAAVPLIIALYVMLSFVEFRMIRR